MSTETAVALGTFAAAAVAWAGMFLPPRQGVWPRTWVAAVFLGAVSVAALVAIDELGPVVEPVTFTEAGIGVAVGAAWLVATHVGYRVLRRLFPGFGDQVQDLYRLGERDTPRRMVGPIVALGTAEELVFRGVLQTVFGLPLAVLAYTAVQVFERKWALCVAALLSGTVWGLLFAWRDGLVAPVVAHLLWTGTLTFLWPLPASGAGAQRGTHSSVSGRNCDQANQNAS